jgi:hypothetical protein
MRRVWRSLRTAGGVVIGLFTGGTVLLAARAVGEGVSTAGADSALSRLIIVVGWFAGAALGCWAASRVAKSHTPAVIVCAWLFSIVWLSPTVRPASLSLRLVCAVAVGIGGFGALLGRFRQPTEVPKQAKAI